MKPGILYICQEIVPYVGDEGGEMAQLCRQLPQAMQERGMEIRTFMPRYGCVNERRNQLHEVIRLSGMNLVIGGSDHQLIIKVASIPAARVQIYFIDNDDYFSRKAMLTDDSGAPFADNDERAIFFARGVIETVSKLRWSPTVVHCHGWFAAIAPLYLRHIFNDDPLFAGVKVVVSLYDDGFKGTLDKGFAEKLRQEGIPTDGLGEEFTYDSVMKFVLRQCDGVVLEGGAEIAVPEGVRVLRPQGDMDSYSRFYEDIF